MKPGRKISRIIARVILVLVVLVPLPAAAVLVDLEIVLAVDVSGSVDVDEFDLQRGGYVNAFRDPDIIAAITGGPIGAIAATFVYWSSDDQQQQAAGWTLIDAASADAFAAAIDGADRPFQGFTSISQALNFSAELFADNSFEGTRLVIDISGDGRNNDHTPDCFDQECIDVLEAERDAAVGQGIIINGLAIPDPDPFSPDFDLLPYYEDHVIGGPGAFAVEATFQSFGEAIAAKVIREVSGNPAPAAAAAPVPEPGTLLLLGSGVAGVGAMARRRNRRN